MGDDGRRRWTLESARSLLPDVRERTERAVTVVDDLTAERARTLPGPASEAIERRIQQRVGLWMREMEALGLEVKGPWLVDFDNGGGYYCWRWPEERLEYFHGYSDGFAGRRRIQ